MLQMQPCSVLLSVPVPQLHPYSDAAGRSLERSTHGKTGTRQDPHQMPVRAIRPAMSLPLL